jgi:hypothetical protein
MHFKDGDRIAYRHAYNSADHLARSRSEGRKGIDENPNLMESAFRFSPGLIRNFAGKS